MLRDVDYACLPTLAGLVTSLGPPTWDMRAHRLSNYNTPRPHQRPNSSVDHLTVNQAKTADPVPRGHWSDQGCADSKLELDMRRSLLSPLTARPVPSQRAVQPQICLENS